MVDEEKIDLNGLIAKCYYEARAKGVSLEDMFEQLDMDHISMDEIVTLEKLGPFEIPWRQARNSKHEKYLGRVSSLEMDLEICDQTLGEIHKEIKKRKFTELTLKELVKFEVDLLKIKEGKIERLNQHES